MPERVLANRRQVRPAQRTSAAALVEILFQLPASLTLFFDLQQRSPFPEKLRRECVCQMVCDELPQTGGIAVWKVTPFVPAAETFSLGCVAFPGVPGAFAFNQIAHAWIVWRAGQATRWSEHHRSLPEQTAPE